MPDCIFCKIANGELPSERVFEDGDFVAILDINPASEGHTLIMPKAHTPNLLEASAKILDGALHVSQKIGQAIQAALKCDGLNFSSNIGEAAGQSVEHLHFHVVPRYFGDGLALWPQFKYAEGRMTAVADKIRKELA